MNDNPSPYDSGEVGRAMRERDAKRAAGIPITRAEALAISHATIENAEAARTASDTSDVTEFKRDHYYQALREYGLPHHLAETIVDEFGHACGAMVVGAQINEQLRADNAHLKAELAAIKHENGALNAENAVIAELEAVIHDYDAKIDALTAEVAELRRHVATVMQREDAAKKRVRALEAEVDALKVAPAPAQPLPRPGQQDVTPYARDKFLRMLDEREARGIATYGTTLQTNNGRDALRDAQEELLDAWKYVCQAEMERAGAVAEVDALKARRCETCDYCTINECEYADGSKQVFAGCHRWKFTNLGVEPDFGCNGWKPIEQDAPDAH